MLAQLLSLHSASHTLNIQIAPEDKKADEVHYRHPLILPGTPLMTSPAAWSNEFEIMMAFPKVPPRGHSVEFPRRGTVLISLKKRKSLGT